ncbi:efflux RND transporter periplasmic adaptor subunit [Acetobacteraceae bacterium ESL0709]|nr:efflux RND transporter periplasmic adaptor subunit [Acetobacteraceae bacterium ESL0697]MDF7678698.1 efflux RND transporter periplasmic adaptor subunit [Acetobacteraceae bacterium ESL0709]
MNKSGPQLSSVHSRLKLRFILFCLLIAALVLAGWGIAQRGVHMHSLVQETEDAAIPRVALISPQRGPETRTVALPANLAAWYEAPIYAQVSGYVKMWYKDYGAHVKKGDLLAEINTPSLDAQFAAAKAQYDVVLARYKLALITSARWSALKSTQAVSRQEVDVQAANADAQKAELEAASHEVERFQALEDFKKIVAPFDGIVTSRLVNVGDYVNGDGGNMSSRGSAVELFSVADVHKIRVFVSVPQDYAAVISPKISADLTVPQYPGRTFHAKFLATAKAFNASTRTVTTELVLDNPERLLWPNSYATAKITAPSDPSILILPTSALLFRAEGTQIAKVEGNHVHLVNVEMGINFGRTMQILSGVKEDDKVVANPTADLLEGDQVKIVPTTHGYNSEKKPKSAPLAPAPLKNETPGDLRRAAASIPDDADDDKESATREDGRKAGDDQEAPQYNGTASAVAVPGAASKSSPKSGQMP